MLEHRPEQITHESVHGLNVARILHVQMRHGVDKTEKCSQQRDDVVRRSVHEAPVLRVLVTADVDAGGINVSLLLGVDQVRQVRRVGGMRQEKPPVPVQEEQSRRGGARRHLEPRPPPEGLAVVPFVHLVLYQVGDEENVAGGRHERDRDAHELERPQEDVDPVQVQLGRQRPVHHPRPEPRTGSLEPTDSLGRAQTVVLLEMERVSHTLFQGVKTGVEST